MSEQIQIPEYQEMLTIEDWKGTFETTPPAIANAKARATKWDLQGADAQGVQKTFRTINTQLPQLKEAVIDPNVKNIEVFDERYAQHLTLGERSAMDKSLAEKKPGDEYRWGVVGNLANVTQDQMESYAVHQTLAQLGGL